MQKRVLTNVRRESSLRHLIETSVLNAILAEMVPSLDEIGREPADEQDGQVELATPDLRSPQSLKTQMSFGDVSVGADVKTPDPVPIVGRVLGPEQTVNQLLGGGWTGRPRQGRG